MIPYDLRCAICGEEGLADQVYFCHKCIMNVYLRRPGSPMTPGARKPFEAFFPLGDEIIREETE